MITVQKGVVRLTEQTVRELLSAIEEAKKVTTFINEPIPDGDIENDTYVRLMRERGKITVRSNFCGISYSIGIETTPQTQESLGYRLVMGSEPLKPGEPRVVQAPPQSKKEKA